MRLTLFLCMISLSFLLFAHEGHHHTSIANTEVGQNLLGALAPPGQPTTWFEWLGNMHLVLLHFPIALINILVLSDLLLFWKKDDKYYNDASRFLLHCAAVLTPITALLGLIHSYSTPYDGIMEIYLLAHMSFGIATSVLVIALAIIRDRLGKTLLYYVCLTLLFVLVNLTGYLGGEMTFGINNTKPPIH